MGPPYHDINSQCSHCKDLSLQAQHIVRNSTVVIYSQLIILRRKLENSQDSIFDEIKLRLKEIEGALDLMKERPGSH